MIATERGTTEWDLRDVADATGVDIHSGTRLMQTWEEQLAFVIAACRRADPLMRPCDLTSRLLAVIDKGGGLLRHDRQRLARHVRRLIE